MTTVTGLKMERVTCPKDGCGWFQRVTTDFPAAEANEAVKIHMFGAHDLQFGGSIAQYAASVNQTLDLLREQSASSRPPPAARMEAATRPTCKEGMSLTEWRSFLHSWKLYKLSTRLTADQETVQLWATMSPSVMKSLTNQGHSLEDSDSADELMKHIKKFCCQGHNIIVERQKFLTITQHAGEKFAKYLARLKGQAEFADFTLECGKDTQCCAQEEGVKGCTSSPGSEGLIFSYANDMIASQAIRGLASAEQQREVLKIMVKDGLTKIELPWLTTFITTLEESGEAAKSLGGGAEVNGVSGHRQNRNNQRQGGNQGGN